jgi:hypothetical protein
LSTSLFLSLEPKISDEEENKWGTYGVGPSIKRVAKEPKNLRGGKNSLEREAVE